MSSGLNQAIVMGRLTSPPEQIQTKSGSVMLKATLEVSTYRRSSDGAGEEQVTRIPATLFGKLATTFVQYVEPGHLVQLVGRLDGYEKKGKDGASWLTLSFVAEQLILLPNGKRPDTPNKFGAAAYQRPWKSQPGEPDAPLDDNRDPKNLTF